MFVDWQGRAVDSAVVSVRRLCLHILITAVAAALIAGMILPADSAYAAGKSKNAYAKSLRASVGELDKKYSKKKYAYKVNLAYDQSSTRITIKRAQKNARIYVKTSAKGKYRLDRGSKAVRIVKVSPGKSKTIYFKIRAQNKRYRKVYKITVHRAKAPPQNKPVPAPIPKPKPTTPQVPPTTPDPDPPTTDPPTPDPDPPTTDPPTTDPISDIPQISSDGAINNAYWEIIEDDENAALDNTSNFTEALEWCAANGYRNVKTAKGTYYIRGDDAVRNGRPSVTLKIPSGMSVNLNGATFIHAASSSEAYAMFGIYDADNVRLYNGILVGDRDRHTYGEIPGGGFTSHEWGFGVEVNGSHNVTLDGLEIYGMTGDAVMLSGNYLWMSDGGRICENVTITGCDLHDCRRQGISIIGANNVRISENDIHDISGTPPEAGIDIEGEMDWQTDNIIVENNRIHTALAVNFAMPAGYEYLRILPKNNTLIGNDIEGAVGVAGGEKVFIKGNRLTNFGAIGGIYCRDSKHARGVVIEENELLDCSINTAITKWIVIRSNEVTNGNISLACANGAIYDNTINNTRGVAQEYGMIVWSSPEEGQGILFKVFSCGNAFIGAFTNTEIDSSSALVTVSQSRAEMNAFLEQIALNGMDNVGLGFYD